MHPNEMMLVKEPLLSEFASNIMLNSKPKDLPKSLKPKFHHKEKLKKLLDELEKHIIRQIGSTPSDKSVYGTTFWNPLIIIPKGDTIKVVLDSRHLN